MNADYVERACADVANIATVLPAALAAIAAGNFHQAGTFMTDDVILDIKGFGRLNGCWQGRDAVVQAMHRNFGMVRDQRPVIDAAIHSGYTTALLLHESGIFVDDGTPYSIRATMWITYADGYIHRVDEIIAAA